MSRSPILTVASALVLLAVATGHAQAQVNGLSTLDTGGAARGLGRALKTAGVAIADTSCQDKRVVDLANTPAPWVLLTTAGCLASLNLTTVTVDGPGSGAPFFFYRLDDPAAAAALDKASPKKIGILKADGHYLLALNQALLARKVPNAIDTDFVNETRLLEALRKGERIHAIAVSDDGTGSAIRELMTTAKRFQGNVTLVPWSPAPTASFDMVLVDQGNQVFAHDIGAAEFAAREGLALPGDLPAQPLIRLSRHRLLEDTVTPESGWAWFNPIKLIDQAFVAVHAAELRLELPIMVTRGVEPGVLARLRAALADASLWAPVEGGINPCHPHSETAYNAFVRAAAGNAKDDPVRIAPLWEHASIRALRKPADYDAFFRVQDTLSALNGAERRSTLFDELDQLASAGPACRTNARGRFSARFGNGKLAYYRQALANLQNYLDPQQQRDRPASLQQAAACLKQALGPKREPSTCGEGSSGMWTEYYAPFLAAAVIKEARTNRVP